MIANETGRYFLVNQWGRLKGKWLYDSSGKRWEVRYYKHAVGHLDTKADDLHAVTAYMNEHFSLPITGEKARLSLRKTIVTPSVVHTLSEYKSLVGMRSHYCFYIQPNSPFVNFRRYSCTTCVKCKDLDFLNCINPSRGSWKETEIQFK